MGCEQQRMNPCGCDLLTGRRVPGGHRWVVPTRPQFPGDHQPHAVCDGEALSTPSIAPRSGRRARPRSLPARQRARGAFHQRAADGKTTSAVAGFSLTQILPERFLFSPRRLTAARR